jgi:exodeoxyribonuclease V gamma subunit
LLPLLLQGATADAVRQLALAGNELPSGAIGERKLELELTALTSFAEQVRAATAEECLAPHQVAIEFDLSGEPWQLQASFADLRPVGLLRSRYDKQRGVDLLGAWLNHLALCAMPPPDAMPCSHWLSIDGRLSFKPVEQPLELLAALLGIYRQGLSEPVHFFPKSAWAYCEKAGEKDGLLSAAQKTWRVSKDRPFAEGVDAGYRLALRGIDEPLDQEFFNLAKLVYGPLIEHIDIEGAN